MSRLSRFLHLERARPEPPREADPDPDAAARFAGVERPGRSPEPPRSSGADLDRFGPEPLPRIELAEAAPDARPFTRCMTCGMDHGLLATECTGCGARLDTPAQRAFNDGLWARRRAEAAREAQAAAEARAARDGSQAELAEARQRMGEALAREVAGRERLRSRLQGGWGGDAADLGTPLGLRLLRALPDWRWQLGAAAAALAVLGALVAVGVAGHPTALLAAIVLAIGLAVPPWRADPP